MLQKKVIFSDLDGTLLDDNYSFEKARVGLEILEEYDIPLVLVSSKTRAEIEVYRKRLGNKHPFISENGGAIFIPRNYFDKKKKWFRKKYEVIELGTKYKVLVDVLNKIKKKIRLVGFSDMSVRELAKDSGLSVKEARLAKKREYDEAFKLVDGKDSKMLFKLVKKHGLNYTKGGRYYHILGNNDKGKAVRILIDLFKKKHGEVFSVGLGDSENDKPFLKVVDKGFLVKGPGDWSNKIIKLFDYDNKFIKKGEELYLKSLEILKKFQLENGGILASSPKGRYPFIYPRDNSICVLGLIDAGLLENARKGLEFIFRGQNENGCFPQRLDRKGRDKSYKPRQLDNLGLVLYATAKYVKKSGDKDFVKSNRLKIERGIKYLRSHLDGRLRKLHDKKYLFFTLNSVHEFPPYETGLEVWTNAVCYGALKELKEIGIGSGIQLNKIKKDMEYLWNGEFFIKNIRLKESSSVVGMIDASAYALADFGVFEDKNYKIKKTVKRIEEELWHPKLGGICRYKEHIGRNNGGYGPWPIYTLMLCRYFIKTGNRQNADKYLEWIFKIAYNGLLPEHIALKEDFEEWISEYNQAGIMRRDRKIMIKNIRKSKMFRKKGLAYSVLPLAWSHAEFIRTWKLYKERFLS